MTGKRKPTTEAAYRAEHVAERFTEGARPADACVQAAHIPATDLELQTMKRCFGKG